MLVPAKRIPLHPSRNRSIKPGESFETPSGLGGTFTVRFDSYSATRAHFTITSSSPPPDGWQGERRAFPIETLHEHICGICPEIPFYDGGKQELNTLRHLGYPEDSSEISTLTRRCPSLKPS